MKYLFGNNLRKKLLEYLFTHPDESFYLRELALNIEEDPGNLSRELKKLLEEGLLNSFSRGKEKFFSLNSNYPYYNELKNLISKTTGLEGSIKNLVNSFKGITFACLYGSYVKNELKKSSDVDLLIVGKYNEANFISKLNELEKRFGREINYSSYLEKEFDKEKQIKGSFLNLILNDKIILLKGAIENE